MRFRYLQLFLLFITVVWATQAVGQNKDMESAKSSVVKIKTAYPAGANGKHDLATATGWCWKEPTLVITALHAVAGAEKITIYKDESKKCDARVEKVLREADLALLRLTCDLGLIPLKLQDADPNSTREYAVWGFPQGIYTMQGDDIRFSRSLEKTPTLNSILTGDKLKFELEEQGYPLPVARILRISSTIQPGHSGAPIMAADGSVIGVADGGLRGGTARINWAMPASYYVPRLGNSTDALPKSPSVQVSLYSTRTTVDADATDAQENSEYEKEAKENTIVNGNQSISKTWTASYDDILETMTAADKKDLEEVTKSISLDMTDTRYDIYEDFATGATITVPYGENFTVKDGWFYTSNADGTLFYDALPFASGTFGDAKNNAYSVFSRSFPESHWVIDPKSPDQAAENDEDETASYEISREANDGSGQLLFYRAEVDGADLLVTFMIYNKALLENPGYMKQYFHFSLAMEMAAFAEN